MPVPSMALNRLNLIYYISINQLVSSTILDQLKKKGVEKDKSQSVFQSHHQNLTFFQHNLPENVLKILFSSFPIVS